MALGSSQRHIILCLLFSLFVGATPHPLQERSLYPYATVCLEDITVPEYSIKGGTIFPHVGSLYLCNWSNMVIAIVQSKNDGFGYFYTLSVEISAVMQ